MDFIKIEEIVEAEKVKLIKPNLPLMIYGAGAMGEILLQTFNRLNIEVCGICDSNPSKWHNELGRFKVQSLEDFLENHQFGSFSVAIGSGEKNYEEIKSYILSKIDDIELYTLNVLQNYDGSDSEVFRSYLLENFERFQFMFTSMADDFSRETLNAVLLGHITSNPELFNKVKSKGQYFNELTKSKYETCFIDAGAYNGDTLEEWLKFSNENFGQIYCLEPFSNNFKKLCERSLSLGVEKSKVKVLPYALNKDVDKLYMSADGQYSAASANISRGQGDLVEAVSLDSLSIRDVSFIKMDIEGSELPALKGSLNTITKNIPKLAICIYHKPTDFLEIFEWLYKLKLDYNFYIRHHGDCYVNQHCETVIYAIK